MTHADVSYDASGYTLTDQLFKALRDRERCPRRPSSISLGRDWFDRFLREMVGHDRGFSFNSDSFVVWAIPAKLDWDLQPDICRLHFEEPSP